MVLEAVRVWRTPVVEYPSCQIRVRYAQMARGFYLRGMYAAHDIPYCDALDIAWHGNIVIDQVQHH